MRRVLFYAAENHSKNPLNDPCLPAEGILLIICVTVQCRQSKKQPGCERQYTQED